MSPQERFLTTAIGQAFDIDHAYGYQCKDVADAYCVALFGTWSNTIGAEDAKDAYANANPTYFDKVPNSPSGVPPRGSIIVWDGAFNGGPGHIAVVLGADANQFDVIEQNGYFVKYDGAGNVIFPGKPAYQQHYKSYAHVIGWLIPKVAQGGNEVNGNIQATDVPGVRIVNTEVKGYPFNDTHTGKFDAAEMAAWTGKPWTQFISEGWAGAEAFRNARNEQMAAYPGLVQQLADLTAEVEALKTQLASAGIPANLNTAELLQLTLAQAQKEAK